MTPSTKDSINWKPSPRGVLTTSSVYNFLTSSRPHQEKDFNWIWALHCPNKIKYFICICHHSRLPTKNYLLKVRLAQNNQCHLCKKSETIKHIFLECYKVRSLWRTFNICHLTDQITLDQHENWLQSIQALRIALPTHAITWKDAFPFFVWGIRLKRNENM